MAAGDIIMFDGPASAPRHHERDPNGPNLVSFVERTDRDLKWVQTMRVARPTKDLPSLTECIAEIPAVHKGEICAIRNPSRVTPQQTSEGFLFFLDIFKKKN